MSLDFDVWVQCFQLHASQPDPFFPKEFELAADAVLATEFGMTKSDINLDNVKVVYLRLVTVMS